MDRLLCMFAKLGTLFFYNEYKIISGSTRKSGEEIGGAVVVVRTATDMINICIGASENHSKSQMRKEILLYPFNVDLNAEPLKSTVL